MDVIDLCDADDEIESVLPTESNKAPRPALLSRKRVSETTAEEKDKATNNSTKLQMSSSSSIATLNAELLETPNIILNTALAPTAKRINRRKSVHQPLPSIEDNIEFLDSNGTVVMESVQSNKFLNVEDLISDPTKPNLPNPNLDLMRRVAFLRVSIQFTLKELGLKPVEFGRDCLLTQLKAQYTRNKAK